jgi:hypothetical protein
MASATRTPEEVETVIIKKASVTLEMTDEEAGLLKAILGQFVASSGTSSMYHALAMLDIRPARGRVAMKKYLYDPPEGLISNSLRWKAGDE